MTISETEYQTMLARTTSRTSKLERFLTGNFPACHRERALHEAILDDCKQRGWLAFHGSTAHSTFRTKGEPDFVILTENRSILLVECKTRTGKQTKEQLGVAAWARKLGHEVFVVRSFEEWKALVELTAHLRWPKCPECGKSFVGKNACECGPTD